MRVDDAQGRIAAIADINDPIANADRRGPQRDFPPAQFDVTRLKPSHLRHSVGTLVDYIYIAGVAGWHPQFSCRAIVCKVVQRYDAGCARQRQRLELIIRGGCAAGHHYACCPKGMDQRDAADFRKVPATN